MKTAILLVGFVLAALAPACAARPEPGLANARRLDNTTLPDPRITDAVANGDDSCNRETGTPLRGRVPACPHTEKKPNLELVQKLSEQAGRMRVPWPSPAPALWTCWAGAQPFLAWVGNVGVWSSVVTQSPASSAIACAME